MTECNRILFEKFIDWISARFEIATGRTTVDGVRGEVYYLYELETDLPLHKRDPPFAGLSSKLVGEFIILNSRRKHFGGDTIVIDDSSSGVIEQYRMSLMGQPEKVMQVISEVFCGVEKKLMGPDRYKDDLDRFGAGEKGESKMKSGLYNPRVCNRDLADSFIDSLYSDFRVVNWEVEKGDKTHGKFYLYKYETDVSVLEDHPFSCSEINPICGLYVHYEHRKCFDGVSITLYEFSSEGMIIGEHSMHLTNEDNSAYQVMMNIAEGKTKGIFFSKAKPKKIIKKPMTFEQAELIFKCVVSVGNACDCDECFLTENDMECPGSNVEKNLELLHLAAKVLYGGAPKYRIDPKKKYSKDELTEVLENICFVVNQLPGLEATIEGFKITDRLRVNIEEKRDVDSRWVQSHTIPFE